MTASDREFLRELRADFSRDLRETVEREHRLGLNTNPHFGMSDMDILRERADLDGDAACSRFANSEEGEV